MVNQFKVPRLKIKRNWFVGLDSNKAEIYLHLGEVLNYDIPQPEIQKVNHN